jgi:hypothetical protein
MIPTMLDRHPLRRPSVRLFVAASAACATFAAVRGAGADSLVQYSDTLYVWNGGVAMQTGPGAWFGSGWDRFPGVNPPWNPVVPMPDPMLGGLAAGGSGGHGSSCACHHGRGAREPVAAPMATAGSELVAIERERLQLERARFEHQRDVDLAQLRRSSTGIGGRGGHGIGRIW